MKQQCYLASIYASWVLIVAVFVFQIYNGHSIEAILLPLLVIIFLRLYVKYFPSLSTIMGYGSVADQAPDKVDPSRVTINLYTGVGCPFCPLVRQRLAELQKKMGFQLRELDVTLKTSLLISKGIKALPVVEIGEVRWVGNATSKQLVDFILAQSTPT